MKKIMVSLVALCLFASCSKKSDPTPTDIRDQVTGTYTGKTTLTIYWTKSTPYIGLLDVTTVTTGSLTISKSGNDLIKFDESGTSSTSTYYANSVTDGSNGIAFKIYGQSVISVPVSNTNIYLTGSGEYTDNSNKYDGLYNKDSKQINYGFNGTASFVSNGKTYNVPLYASYVIQKQ